MLVSAAVFLIPILVSIAAATVVVHLVSRPRGAVAQCAWWAAVIVIPWVIYVGVGRLARRALPLAALLKMTLVFPDEAPNRMAVARRAGSTRSLERQVHDAQAQGVHDEPAQAAERILALAASLNRHDRLTRGHSERVRVLTDLIADELKLTTHDRDRLRWSALLHDIGKVSVPEPVLNKPEKLDADEWAMMKRHPEEGSRLTAALAEWLGPWADTIIQHHEKFDGSGYPFGLAGEAISLGGRIVAVADCYETMTAVRSYKRPMSATAAKEELTRCAGTHFDPMVVRAFLGTSVRRPSFVGGPLAALAEFSSNNMPRFEHLVGTAGNVIAASAVVAGVGIASVVGGHHGAAQSASATPEPHGSTARPAPSRPSVIATPQTTVTTSPAVTTTDPLATTTPTTTATAAGQPSPARAGVPTPLTQTTVPYPPSVGSVVAENAQVTVAWSPPTDDGGSGITGYLVTAHQGSTSLTPVSSGPTFDLATVTGLTNGLPYWFTVTAVNAIGAGPPSDPSSSVVPSTTPGAPGNPDAVPSSQSVQLSWSPPPDTGGLAVTGYTVFIEDNGVALSPHPFTSAVTTQSLTGLTNGDSYSFSVGAINPDGMGPVSASSAVVIPSAPPGVPGGATAVAGNGQAWVSWTPPSDNGGSPIVGYEVVPYFNGSPAPPITYTSTATTEVVSGLVNGGSYAFSVEAINADGSGLPSVVSAAITPTTVPSPPTGVTATPGNGQVSLSWTAPADDGGSLVTGYTVIPYISGVPGTPVSYPSSATTETVSGLTNGTGYSFAVEAQNSDGTGTASTLTSAVTPSTVPDAATGVVGTGGDAQVALSWTAPAQDGGSPITGYIVTPYIGTTAQPWSGYASSATAETVTGLTNGTSYTFTVQAVNSEGTGPPSAATALITPSTTPSAPTSVVAVPGDGQVSLSWTAPAQDGGSTISGYLVTPDEGGIPQSPIAFASTTTTEVVTGLTNGATYTFTVQATNGDGNGPASVQSAGVVPVASTSTLTITNGSGNAGRAEAGDQITVNFASPPDPALFCSSWSSTAYPDLTGPAVTVTGQKNPGSDDTIGGITAPACAGGFHFGTIDLGQTGYFNTAVVFTDSTIHWDGSNTLTITLGNPSLGDPTQGAPSVAVYTPDPGLGLSGTISSINQVQF